ncbi:MAG TPA: class I SAM-dependent methyltransferase [Bacteroidota bacterium]|nr:class I SAM-dependent methyltransferase [Bacteroidota bacterium]
MLRFSTASGDERLLVREYFEQVDDVRGKVVIDIPAGTGHLVHFLHAKGANVEAFDLFPELFEAKEITCKKADLQQPLPVKDNHADYILCQEGIEHLPNQLFALREFNRTLKNHGVLIVTTPSASHLRAKLSHLLLESEMYNRFPENELNGLWFSKSNDMYYGHLFLVGIQRLRVLARVAGFRIRKIHPVKISYSSLALAFLYPLILLMNLFAYYLGRRRDQHIDAETKRDVYREIMKLNLHPTILFGKHLFIEFEKEKELNEAILKVHKPKASIC